MFKIGLRNFYKNVSRLIYHQHQPSYSDLENMPYFEYQYAIQDLVEILKEKADAEKKQNDIYKTQQKAVKKPNYKKSR